MKAFVFSTALALVMVAGCKHHEQTAGQTDASTVTSGPFSPTLQMPTAMGYVRGDLAAPGNELTIDVRGNHEPAHVVPLPFYRRTA